jgi:hypothetical protein
MTELRRGGLIRGGTTILWTFDCSVGNQEIFFYSVSWVSHFHNIIYRKWSTVDGKCQKIFRGHRDTILCIEVLENVLCTGSKDASCKSE